MPKTSGVIAAGHQKTTEAGQQIFAQGGNAFDAAIAAILAAFVVESPLTSAGGGGFLLAHTPDNNNILFDFFTQTPSQKKPLSEINFYPVNLDFGGETQVFHIGLGSMAVPGNLAGIFAVHQQLGRLPFSIVAEPAIDYATNGFIINKYQSFCHRLLEPIFTTLPEAKKIYAPAGKLLTEGDVCYMKDFANILTELAAQGAKEFYQGALGHKLVKDCQELGGYLTLDDLHNYQVIKRKPLEITYRNYDIITNPPPSSGGILIAYALKVLEQINLENIEYGSPQHLEILQQVMNLTNDGRKNHYDAYIYEEDISDRFLSQVNQINQLNKYGSTTHISVIDSEGNAASVTTSNGEGSSYIIPGTGIMMNNMLGEADLNPFGFHNWELGKRISSMMAPTMILKQGKPEIVLGSGGSNRIRTAILQVISNIIDYKFSLTEAVENPRVHWENNILSIEPPYKEIQDLTLQETTQLVLWQEKNMFFGGVNAVTKKADGSLEGAGDSRREGAVL